MYLIHLDILGFEGLAEEIADKKGIDPRIVRKRFIDVIKERVGETESRGKIVGKKYEESDDWLLATDSLDKVFSCIYEILDHNTGYENYEKIPLEIAIGKGEYDKWARFDGRNLVVENGTINFLKTNIVDYFRRWYKTHHNNESIKNTFIILTESVYLDFEALDRKLCQKIEYSNPRDNKTISFFASDVAKFQQRGKVLEFLEKIEYPNSKRYGRIDCVYVLPLEYEDIVETLREKRVVFITGTQGYGKTFTAVRLMWEYFNDGYEPSWIRGSELPERGKVRETLENIETVLKPKHIIYFEDPFGKTEYEKREGLGRGIETILERIKQVEDVYVIITSREEVFKEFEKEKLSLTELKDFEKKVGLRSPSYTYEKKRQFFLIGLSNRIVNGFEVKISEIRF